MRYLIFSDTHLGKNFDKKKFHFLEKIIKDSDQVIIDGDFWEGGLITFDEFINSEWKRLFPILLAKKTIYIYGNHDPEKLCNDQVNLFSVTQSQTWTLLVANKKLLIEHGKRVALKDFGIITKPIKLFDRWFLLAYEVGEWLMIKLFSDWFFKIVYGMFNREAKEYIQKNLKMDEILIIGHTHCPELSIKDRLINVGFIKHGLAHYLIIEDNRIALKTENY